MRALNDGVRVVCLYAIAGPQTTSVGCFRLSTAIAVEDLGGTAEVFEERLQVVCHHFGWAWDPISRVIWITNWFDENPPANPNVVQAWAKLLRNVPDCDIKTRAIADIWQRLKELPASFREPWRELLKSFPGTESKAQSRTETLQGNREQGAGIREQRAGAGLRTTTNDNGAERRPSSELVRLVKETTLKISNPFLPVPELVESFLNQHQHLRLSRADATAAVNAAVSERKADVS